MQQQVQTADQTARAIQILNHGQFMSHFREMRVIPRMLDDKISLTLEAEGKQMLLAEKPASSLLRAYGLSQKFLDTCTSDLALAEQAIRVAHASQTDGSVVVTTAYNDTVVGFKPMKKPFEGEFLPLRDAWEAIRKVPGVDGCTEVNEVGRGQFEIRIVSGETFAPQINVGDITRSGIRVSLPSTGIVTVNPYIYRLVCSNGMQRMEEGDVLLVDMTNPINSIEKNVLQCLEYSRELAVEFVGSDQIVIPNPADYTMRALRIAGASNNLRSTVTDLIRAEAPRGTLYEITNIVTSIARQASSPAKRNSIESLAGRLIAMQASGGRCKQCDSRVETTNNV